MATARALQFSSLKTTIASVFEKIVRNKPIFAFFLFSA